eukprot:gene10270-11365_t
MTTLSSSSSPNSPLSADSSKDYGSSYHIPVMKDECLHYLKIEPDQVYVDCTLGGGGHTEAILDKGGKVIAIDQDPDAIQASSQRLKHYLDNGRLEIHRANFRSICQVVANSTLAQQQDHLVDGVLMDLGISSYQIDAASRGFSFGGDGPLDMRMHKGNMIDRIYAGPAPTSAKLTAATIVNEWSEEDIANVLYYYGEETRSRRLARAITAGRPYETTDQLQQVIGRQVSFNDRPKTLAKCFQALRIVVNDEINALEEALQTVQLCLRPGGRLVVLSYHSLEDRRVKSLMKTGQVRGEDHDFDAFSNVARRLMAKPSQVQLEDAGQVWRLVEKKPLGPSPQEIERNSRSRSAKLRVAEKIDPSKPLETPHRHQKHIGAKQARRMAEKNQSPSIQQP